VKVELCVGDIMSAIAAEAGGADRVELCDNLAVGGTTPSAGAIVETCRRLSIPVHVLIRPRGGDFVYSEAELAVMRHDIQVAKASGAAGVVLGVLTGDSAINCERTGALIELARPMTVTFHKAFDQSQAPLETLDTLIALSVDRVLTSGGQPSAQEGTATLAGLVARAGTRITVVAGGRLDIANLQAVLRQSGVTEVHLGSAASRTMERAALPTASDIAELCWKQTDAVRVAEIVALARRM
jgi:copper homeostasis protein